MAAKLPPPHVITQREKQKTQPAKPLRHRRERSESYDVFRRINMHDGNKDVCWEWQGSHGMGTRNEYRPRVVIDRKDYYVYRVVYELYTGYKLLKGEVIRHQCDNCWCCNPHHMLIGTQQDNVQDMLNRERVGIKHFHIKRIMQMLEIGCTAQYVCEKMKQGYDMSIDASLIRKIRLRRVYKHIPWPWGDDYSKQRRLRLNELKSIRLAADSTHAIIEDTTNIGGSDASILKDEDESR